MVRLIVAALVLTTSAADWPQWRGPKRDGISADTGLLQEWPEGGPKLRWKRTDIGTGYSSPIVVSGQVYLQSTRGDKEMCLALDEKSGETVWSQPIGAVGRNRGPQYPGTRTTPTFDDSRLYCLSSAGDLVCLKADGGQQVWRKSLPNDLGGKVGAWAYSESVLVDGDAVVCTPGGETAGLAKLNKMTGDVIWKSALPDGDVADYASIMTVEGGGRKQYVQFLRKGVAGVDAKTGQFLWRYEKPSDQGANILTPVVLGGRVFAAGSRSGGGLVELKPEGDGVAFREVYFDRALSPSIGGAVVVDGHLFGAAGQNLVCADFSTGKILWKDKSVGASSICFADGRLYVRGHSKDRAVALVEPAPEGYRERGRFTPPQPSDIQAWPHPVVANGGLYLRDQNTLLCYDVRKNH